MPLGIGNRTALCARRRAPGPELSRGSESLEEATAGVTSNESVSGEKRCYKHLFRKVRCLGFCRPSNAAMCFGLLARTELFVFDGTARGGKSLNLVLSLVFISLRVASILTDLSC